MKFGYVAFFVLLAGLSGGGMFGGYKGTCAILGRCVKTLGKDVAEWLAQPTSQAVLGDL